MQRRVQFASIIAVILAVASLALAGGDSPTEQAGGPNVFVDKVVYVVTRPHNTDGDVRSALYEKVEVIPLGDRPFLVGSVPDYDGASGYKAAVGKRVWTPISEIVQMTEFESLDDAKQYFNSILRRGKQSRPPGIKRSAR